MAGLVPAIHVFPNAKNVDPAPRAGTKRKIPVGPYCATALARAITSGGEA